MSVASNAPYLGSTARHFNDDSLRFTLIVLPPYRTIYETFTKKIHSRDFPRSDEFIRSRENENLSCLMPRNLSYLSFARVIVDPIVISNIKAYKRVFDR